MLFNFALKIYTLGNTEGMIKLISILLIFKFNAWVWIIQETLVKIIDLIDLIKPLISQGLPFLDFLM